MRRFVTLVLSLVLVQASTSGCSLMVVRGAPANYEGQKHVECTSNRVAPTLDLLGATFCVLGIAVFATARDEDLETRSGESVSRGTGFAVYGTGLALLGGSATYGFSRVGACAKARADVERRNASGFTPGLDYPLPRYDTFVATTCLVPSVVTDCGIGQFTRQAASVASISLGTLPAGSLGDPALDPGNSHADLR